MMVPQNAVNIFITSVTVIFLRRTLLHARHLLHPENGGSKALRNVGTLPQHYTVSQPRRP